MLAVSFGQHRIESDLISLRQLNDPKAVGTGCWGRYSLDRGVSVHPTAPKKAPDAAAKAPGPSGDRDG
jgi:hypothetical protein